METFIDILVDNSNSMGYAKVLDNPQQYLLPDGTPRMELAKKILVEEIIPTIDYTSQIKVKLFHSVYFKDNRKELKIETIYQGEDLSTIKEKISKIPIPEKTGGTPITDAILNSIESLKKHSNDDRKIILVTDGQETDGKDYKVDAKKALTESGIPFNIFIVGIAHNSEAQEKAEIITKETGGAYLNVESKVYSKEKLQQKLSFFKRAIVSNSIEKIVQKPKLTEKDNVVSNENVESAKEKENEKIMQLEKKIENNSNLLTLISKQITLLQDDIKSYRVNDFDEDEDDDDENVIIKENTDLNEQIRSQSEYFLFELLKNKYGDRLKWLNKDGESGESIDFKVVDEFDGEIEFYIECKATSTDEKVFLLTNKEWDIFLKNPYKYIVYFIYNALKAPKIIKIDNLLDWILKGKIVPYPLRNRKVKAERILFTIMEKP